MQRPSSPDGSTDQLEMKHQLAAMGAEPVGNTSAQMAAQIRGEVEKFSKLAQKAKLSIE